MGGPNLNLSAPWIISARLLPAVCVGPITISIAYAKKPGRDGRTRYQYHIDHPDGRSYSADDVQSGCNGGRLVGGMLALLAFLGAFLEAQRYPNSENRDLFPNWIADTLTDGDLYFSEEDLINGITE